jgi:hypothetical protein
LKLYVAEALKKSQLAKEIFKFKNSKKRCNLFVKGFAPDTTEEQLKAYFDNLTGGDQIESLKIEHDKQEPTKAKLAIVCFKSPDQANNVKQLVSSGQHPLGNNKLFINNYELKEVRDIQLQDVRDKANYQNATQQQNHTGQIDQVIQKPEVFQTLMYLLSHMNNQNRGGRPQGQYQNRGPHQGQRPMGGMPPQQRQQPIQMRFQGTIAPIIPGVTETNPIAKDIVGERIYEFVVEIIGEEKAPKVTGMLIDLPLEEIREYLGDFARFKQKVDQAGAQI